MNLLYIKDIQPVIYLFYPLYFYYNNMLIHLYYFFLTILNKFTPNLFNTTLFVVILFTKNIFNHLLPLSSINSHNTLIIKKYKYIIKIKLICNVFFIYPIKFVKINTLNINPNILLNKIFHILLVFQIHNIL